MVENKDYIEAFNQGYELSRELGLKPDILKDLASGNNRMKAMYEGMKQHEKEKELEKSKDIIPPFDVDKFDDRNIHIDDKDPTKDQDKDIDF